MAAAGKSVLLAWIIMSVAVLPVLAAPFLLPAETICRLEPVCEWKAKYNRECPLCGMTRAFVAISRGRLGEADAQNRGGVPLYAGLVVNELAAAAFAARIMRRPGWRAWLAANGERTWGS